MENQKHKLTRSKSYVVTDRYLNIKNLKFKNSHSIDFVSKINSSFETPTEV